MANSRKKISELPALNVASLDTTFVLGISGSTTYKISINNLTSSLDTTFATDLVTATLSSSLNSKLSTSSFNSYTSSFTASVANGTISGSSQLTASFDTRYVVSGSITQTTWDNIANKPSGIVSQSTDLSSLNTFTASISTASLVNRLNAIESVSGSWITESETGSFLTSLSGAISSSTQISDLGFVTGSYTTINSFNSLTQSFNSISQSFNVISGSVGTVDFNGIVSGSSQLTSSYDTRYTLSGSVQPLPSNLLSSSAQITAFGFISSSQTIDSGSLVTTSSFNSYTASLNAFSSSLSVTANSSTKILDAYYTSAAAWSGSYSGNGGTVKVEANFALYSTSIGTKTFTLFRNGIAVDSGSFYFNNTGVHTTMPTLYYIGTNETGTNTYSVGHNAVSDAGDSCNIVVTETFNTLNAGLISGSAQITALGFVSGSYETTGRGIISSSANLVTTSSFNSYTASISTASLVTSISNLNSATSSYLTSLSGAISSSSQLTSSFATTGSNSFNGNQTITGSLVVSAVAVVNGGITVPTGSTITLTSGSSISVDSSGTITSLGGITGSIAATNGVVSGSSQLISSFPSKTTGTWSVPANASTQSFTVEAGASYTMWVNGNIPNGIITWNATVTTANTNVPVVGSQHGWYYSAGNALVLTSMPDQITGTNGSIVNTPASYAPNTSNVFKFGITNNSGASQTINYGYIKLS